LLQSVEKLIEQIEKDKSITLSENQILTKYLLVGYDIHGRNWSRHVRLDSAIDSEGVVHKNITEQKIAELRGYDSLQVSNSKRNRFREKLLDMGAMYLSDSLYLLPLKVVKDNQGKDLDVEGAEEFLRAWGDDEHVNLHVMGFELQTKRSIEGVSKVFKKVLTDRFDEMEKHLESAHNRLLDLADDVIADPKKAIRGIHRIVEAMNQQAEDAQELINRYSDDEDETRKFQFNLSKIMALNREIGQTYREIVNMKERAKE
jgi:Ran GTPase-activating protein (RanGAP) involved in mRNA processing and transport